MNRDDALDTLVETLELLVPIAKAVPALGSTIEGVLEAAIKVIKFAQSVNINKENTRELAAEAARWTEALVKALAAAPPAHLPILQGHIEEMTKALKEIARSNKQRAKQTALNAVLHKSRDAEETQRMRTKLNSTYERFMVAAQIRHDIALASITEAHARTHQAIPSLIVDGHTRHDAALVAIAASQAQVLPTLLSDADREVLKSLCPVRFARHDSRNAPTGCLAHTREDVLGLLNEWVQQRTSQLSIFWLAGMAGTGKTTIAKTFCDRMDQNGKLGASFFISRHDEARREPSAVVRSLAYSLAYALPRVRKPILDALRSFADVLDASLEQLVPRLIASPLSAGRDSCDADDVVVLVIEALDECQKFGRLEGGQLIPLLASTLQNQPVKLLITSRMEKSISDMFILLSPVSIRLHDIDKDTVATDMHRYFEDSFAEIKRVHHIGDTDWPSTQAIQNLTEKAGHLFIYASTVVRYVGNDQHNPRGRLQEVLQPRLSTSASPYRLVDELYLQVLLSAVETTEDDENLLCTRLRSLLGAIVFVRTPLTLTIIANLLAVDFHELRIIIHRLSAILLPGMDQPVRLFHVSFQDFIVDTMRCKDTRFRLDPREHHQALAVRCVTIMNTQLRRDICSICDPTLPNSDVSDLPQRIERSVSPELRYSTVFWADHISCAETIKALDVLAALAEFCDEHVLHWLELLSLLGLLSVASKVLPTLLVWAKNQTDTQDIRDVYTFLQDTLNVVREYTIPVRLSALQVYHSVLVFMPDCALFRRASQIAKPIARMTSSRETTWSRTAMILEGHTEEVNSVAFSPDGSWIVSCSSDHTARIWEVSSGESRAIFEKHGVPITAAAFSTDGLQVALGDAHGCVILWNIFSGLKATGAHYDTHSIICIAYRRDDAHVVSCTKTTICFMAVLACQLVRVIHLEDLCLVSAEIQTMSPDASRVCILHRFGSLNIWDIGDDLDLVQRINLDGCSKLAFSADGQRAVFLNPHHALELIDFHDDGDIVSRTSEIHHSVHVLAVSSAAPASVALYGDSDVVLLRDLVSATQVVSRSMATLGQHATQSLSLDGRWVVSGSKVGTIGIWETNDEASTSLSSPAPNQRDSVSMTHLSRDGMWLTCVMSKGLIIYNTTHGNVLASLDLSPAKPEGVFLGDTLWMAMSPDSVRLAFFVKTEKFAPSSGHLCIWHLYERTLHYFPPTTPITHQSSRHDRHCPVLWSLDSSLCAVVVTGGRVHVWDVIAWTLKADLDLPGLGEFSYLHHAEFSSDGRHLLLIFWKIIHDRIKRLDIFIWSTNNWLLDSVNVEFSERDINPMYIPSSKVSAFSPKGTDLITFRRATGGLYLRNIGDHESLSQMCQNHTRIQEVVWSCDSSHVALMNRRREVMVWSTALGTASSQLTKISHHNLSGDTLKPVEPAFSSSGLLSFSADGRRICARSSGVENHWKIGADFITLSLDNPAREMIATTGGVSVDIIASDRSGWLRYSRSDRANLVSLLWVPFQRRWLKPEDVQVTGSKVAFRSASGELTTILDFPYLLDLYRLSEPDHNA